METRTNQPQRTGWVILVLMVATNFLPWMEPLVRETLSPELVTAQKLRLSMGACLLGGALVAMTWLAGRHAISALPRALSKPRLIGFQIALVCAGANIALGIVVAKLGASGNLDLYVGATWFLAILPAEVFSSYLTGRGSVRRPSPAPETTAVPSSELSIGA
jgi:hypothetical protein